MSGREGGLEPGALLSNWFQIKLSPQKAIHLREKEPVTFLGRPHADLAKPRAGLRQSAPQRPAPRGRQVADSGLVWAKPSCQAWLWRQLSLYFSPGGSIGLAPHLSLRQTSARPARTPDAAWGWGWGQLDSPTSGRSLKINNNNDNNDNSNN